MAYQSGTDALKFSDMTESEIAKIVEEYRKKAPIEIPDTAKYKAKSMADGYVFECQAPMFKLIWLIK